MGRAIRNHCNHLSRRHRSTSDCQNIPEKGGNAKNMSSMLEREMWKQATCAVCLEFPHSAVLLLCSSHDKGCRPYMCGTGFRLSNCLEQFKKAYSLASSSHDLAPENAERTWPEWKKPEATDLKCPLCRGQVKGWTVLEPARRYLNKKKRSCMHGDCSFIGNYKQLQKHVKVEHHSAKTRAVDPNLELKWKMIENQSERQDVISTIRSSMPGAIISGDYVIDMTDDELSDDLSIYLNGIIAGGNNRYSRWGLGPRLTRPGRRADTVNAANVGRTSSRGGGTTARTVISARHRQQNRREGLRPHP